MPPRDGEVALEWGLFDYTDSGVAGYVTSCDSRAAGVGIVTIGCFFET